MTDRLPIFLVLFLAVAGRVEAGPAADENAQKLVAAVIGNDVKAIGALVAGGADINARRELQQDTPLLFAATWSDVTVDMVRFLVEHGADPSLKDPNGSSPLVLAAVNSEASSPVLDKVKYLATLIKDPAEHRKAVFGCFGHLYGKEVGKVIGYFLDDLKVDPGSADQDGRTLLMAAAESFYDKTVQALLKKGAAVNAEDPDGNTALLRALSSYPIIIYDRADGYEDSWDFSAEFKRTLDVLLAAGADAGAKNKKGRTSLMAFLSGQPILSMDHLAVKTVKLLLDHGADPKAKDADGRTALDCLDTLSADETLPRKIVAKLRKMLK